MPLLPNTSLLLSHSYVAQDQMHLDIALIEKLHISHIVTLFFFGPVLSLASVPLVNRNQMPDRYLTSVIIEASLHLKVHQFAINQ